MKKNTYSNSKKRRNKPEKTPRLLDSALSADEQKNSTWLLKKGLSLKYRGVQQNNEQAIREAIVLYRQAPDLDTNLKIQFAIADAHRSLGEVDEARKYYEKIYAHCKNKYNQLDEDLKKNYLFVLQSLATYLQDEKKVKEALLILEERLQCRRDGPSLMVTGYVYENLGSSMEGDEKTGYLTKALKLYEESLKVSKQESHQKNLKINIGKCYEKLGNYQKALHTYRLIKNYSDDTSILKNISNCEKHLIHPTSKTLEQFRNQLKNEPNNQELRYKTLEFCEALGYFDEAVFHLKQIKDYETNERLLRKLCFIFKKQRKWVDLEKTAKAISNWKKDVLLVELVCHSFNQRTMVESALSLIEEVNPQQKTFGLSIVQAETYREKEEFEKARQHLANIIPHNSKEEEDITRAYALVDYREGHLSLAIQRLQKYWDEKGTLSFDSIQLLSMFNRKQGKFTEAILNLQKFASWETNRFILKELGFSAFCAKTEEKLKEALDFYKKIPDWQHDEEILLAVVRTNMRLRRFSDAWDLLTQSKIHNHKKRCLIFAEYYFKMNQIEDALSYIHKIPGWEKDFIALEFVAKGYSHNKQFEKALEHFNQIINPPISLLRKIAYCQRELGLYDAALKTLSKSTGNDRKVRLDLAITYEKKGDLEAALEAYKKISDFDKNEDTLVSVAIILERLGRFEEAIFYLEKVGSTTKNPKHLLSLGRCYESVGKYKKAISYLEKIPTIENNLRLISCLLKQNFLEKADKKLSALKWDEEEGNPDIIGQISYCYIFLGNYKKADEILNHFIAKHGENYELILQQKGYTLFWLGNYQEALSYFQRCPLNKDTANAISRCYEYLNQMEMAITVLTQFRENTPAKEDKEIILRLSHLYFKTSQYEKGLEILGKSSKEDKEVLLTLARLSIHLNQFEKAFEYLNRIKEEDKPLLMTRAFCYISQHKFSEACKEAEKIPNWENDEDVILMLTKGFISHGNLQEANKFFKKMPDLEKCKVGRLVQADLLIYEGNYPEAEQILQDLKKAYAQDKEVLATLGHFYFEKEQYQEAILAYMQVPNWQIFPEIIADIASCQFMLKSFDPRLLPLINQPSWRENKKIALYKGRLCLENNNIDGALQEFQRIPDWNKDRKVLISIAYYYRDKNDFINASDYLKKIKNHQTNVEAQLALGKINLSQRKYDSALSHFQQAVQLVESNETLFFLGICHAKRNELDKALAVLSRISPPHDTRVRLQIARLYKKQNQFEKALGILNEGLKNDPKNKELLLLMGNILALQKDEKNAVAHFEKIPDWQEDKNVLLAYARFYQRLRNYDKALTFLEMIPVQDEATSLLMARCYDAMGYDEKAALLYDSLIKDHVNNNEIWFFYCSRLIAKEDELAEKVLEESIKRMPYEENFYLLQINLLFSQRKMELAEKKIQEFKHHFPHAIEGKLKEIEYDLILGKKEEKEKKVADFQKKYQRHPSAIGRLNCLLSAKLFFIRTFGNFLHFFNEEPKVIRVTLPDFVKEKFDKLSKFAEVDLVGNAVLQILDNKPESINELDFVGTVDDNKLLAANQLQQDKHCSNLYKETIQGPQAPVDVELFIEEKTEPNVPTEDVWQYKTALKRDFSITSILCTKDGKIIDYSTGLRDFEAKRLRMLGKPELRLKEDLKLLLRSIHYITKGYQPDEDLEKALKEWKTIPQSDEQREKLYALARKHVYKHGTKATEYVKNLKEYGLLDKLFGLVGKGTEQENLVEFVNLVSSLPNHPPNKFSFKSLEGSKYTLSHFPMSPSQRPLLSSGFANEMKPSI